MVFLFCLFALKCFETIAQAFRYLPFESALETSIDLCKAQILWDQ